MTRPEPITPVIMPNWGLSMTEGKIVGWMIDEGSEVKAGDGLVEIETTKLTGVCEAHGPGVLRRILAVEGLVKQSGELIAVISQAGIADAEIDAFVAKHAVKDATAASAVVNDGPTRRSVTVAGETISVIEQGDGGDAPLLLLHGLGGSAEAWAQIQALQARHRRVIALDLPGHGGSTKRLSDPSPSGIGALVVAVADNIGLDAVHLVGHSFGGAVACAIAATRPERVRSLILVAPASFGEPVSDAFLDAFVAARDRRGMAEACSFLFADPGRVSRAFVQDLLDSRRIDGVQDSLAAIVAAMRTDQRDRSAPPPLALERMMLLWGNRDAVVPLPAVDPPPGWVRHVFAGIGHLPHLEAPAAFNSVLDGFLGSSASTQSLGATAAHGT